MNDTTQISQRVVASTLLDDTKILVDDYVQSLLELRTKEADAISKDYGDLWRSIHSLFSAGGKRLRPYMVMLAYSSGAQDRRYDDILPAAAAQELLHLGVLIHDDIIDRDQVRYGVKNITGQYNDTYRQLVTDNDERLHFSRSAAIMAGDLLISEAYNQLRSCAVETEAITRAQAVLHRGLFGVAGGELLDTEAAFRPFADVDILTIATQKTASYSFVSPLSMGAVLAGLPNEFIGKFERFGTALGIAFQLQDDLLGVFGDETVTGKSTSGDIREAKHTYMVEQFYSRATDSQRKAFATAFNNQTATESMIETARKMLFDSGAKQAVEATIATYADTARQELAALEIQSDSRANFEQLIQLCTHRQK